MGRGTVESGCELSLENHVAIPYVRMYNWSREGGGLLPVVSGVGGGVCTLAPGIGCLATASSRISEWGCHCGNRERDGHG